MFEISKASSKNRKQARRSIIDFEEIIITEELSDKPESGGGGMR